MTARYMHFDGVMEANFASFSADLLLDPLMGPAAQTKTNAYGKKKILCREMKSGTCKMPSPIYS